MNRYLVITLVVLVSIVIAGIASAEVPHMINFQGYLVDDQGPVTGDFEATFRIYNEPSGGNILWEETDSIIVEEGLYSIILGETTPLDIAFDGNLWLGVQLNGQSEMTPRYRLTSVPYAINAVYADTGAYAQNIADNSITSSKIVNRSIQFEDIDQNGAQAGEIMKWNGNAWTVAEDQSSDSSNSGWVCDNAKVYLADSTNHVGIGTANPINNKLYVFENANRRTSIFVKNPNYGDSVRVWIGAGEDSSHIAIGRIGHNATAYSQYGEPGNGYIYNSWHGKGLNIIVPDDEEGYVRFYVGTNARGTPKLSILRDGNVGIGTTNPSRKLTVRGNILLESANTGNPIMELGEGLDYAEGFNVSDGINMTPGSVLIIDPDNPGNLTLSSQAYDSKVAGIVAGAKNLGSGVRLGAGQFDLDVALAGRVYCNVDATKAGIEPGDLLTTSDTPGYAMKVLNEDCPRGAILGKAMEGLEQGKKAQILVLVTLQ